jgi:hypothetical protein
MATKQLLALPNCRVFQLNQAVSNETHSGFLCAPDGNAGGWRRLTEMEPGDVILHNVKAHIRAVSVVQPMNLEDERLTSRKDRIRLARRVEHACLWYEGEHLSIDDFPATTFLACLIRTVLTDLALPYARRFGGYAVEVLPQHLTARPDLADVAMRAWLAVMPPSMTSTPKDPVSR